MKAIAATQFGDTSVLESLELDQPTPGEYDLLIEVHYAAVNPVDCKVRDGSMMEREFPLVMGYDASGVVVEVGEKVEHFKPGDAVYGSPNLVKPGSNAAYCLLDARAAALKPQTVEHGEAAALPLVALTAWEALHDHARMHNGETVLIQAGGGGVGHIAIQLAKLHDCRVITTASEDASIRLCEELGADEVINYKQQDVTEVVMKLTDDAGCQVVFDCVGGDVFKQSIGLVAGWGRLVTILPPPDDAPIGQLFMKNGSIHQEFMGGRLIMNHHPEHQGQILQTITELVDANQLRPHISHEFALSELAQAHQQQETNHTQGKIVVKVR